MPAKKKEPKRTLDALPDTVDFRDTLYIPTLVPVRPASDIGHYRSYKIPVLDQGSEGACTGFGLATVANYLIRARGENPSADEVSAWMIYTMAKRYDEWPGEEYQGSSARGAIKGWHKHGLCALRLWKDNVPDVTQVEARAADAVERPLGAYFRVNHKDLVSIHAAISEVGILFASATVHAGWQAVRTGDAAIDHRPGAIGGHAFAIVGYDRDGFWIQNSWGPSWGQDGLALLSYADWLANGTDIWVATLGAPVRFGEWHGAASMLAGAPRSYESRTYSILRPHIVMAKNDGILDEKGPYGLTEEGLRNIIVDRMPTTMASWAKKRVVLYAHGGLVSEQSAIQTVASNLDTLLKSQVYPISFIWRSDLLSTLGNILKDVFSRRQSEGILDPAKDFMFDRVDDMIEPVARALGGKALWDEMKENAERCTTRAKGAARLTAQHIAALYASKAIDEIHIVGHSAGAILHAYLADYLVESGVSIKSVSLWAPACTLELFNKYYKPLVGSGKIENFDLYTLDDGTEQDDNCAHIYNKSLLYLVSAAFEEKPRIPVLGRDGTPLLGLEKDADTIEGSFWRAPRCVHHIAPGSASQARHHGDFDNDTTTLLSTLRRITGTPAPVAVTQAAGTGTVTSGAQNQRRRQRLDSTLARRRSF